ncbi:MAG: crotonase/enoyl-CoA hydratase family protein [Burkholderiaceae bacterium]
MDTYPTYTTLAVSIDERVMTLELSRPDRLNAFTVEMANELVDVFTRASGDDAVGAIVVTGAGRAFCAGMELAREGNVFGLDETLEPTLADLRERYEDPVIVNGVRDTGGRVALSIFECRKPVIGAINGAAVGVGITMTLAMDARLASERAKFGFVFGKLGIVPEACSTWFLPRLVGLTQALDWIYSARIFEPDEALRAGLVSSVHPPGELVDAARRLARSWIDGRSGVATAVMRQMMMRNSAAPSPHDAHRIESLGMFYTSRGDGHEGVAAFLAKRDAQYTARASADMPPFYPWWERP